MSEPLKIGLIGYGTMGGLHHQAVAQHGRAVVTAVCTRSAERQTRAREAGVARVFADHREMLAQARPQAVIISLPDRMHCQVVLDCLAAGCDVLVEKPLATTADEARRMHAAAQQAGRRLVTNFSFRWERDFQYLHNQLQAGALGAPRYIYMRVSDSIVVPTQWITWAGESSPTEFLMPHAIDLARWLTGQEVRRVYARMGEGVLHARGIETHDHLTALCELDGGTTLCLESSWILPESHPTVVDFHVELQGEKGMARLDRKQTGIEIYGADRAMNPITWLATLSNGKARGFFYESVHHFIDCLLDPTLTPIASPEDGVVNTIVLESILHSARSGVPIDVITQ